MSVKSYIELDVWIKCRELVNWIYSITKEFSKEEIFGLTNQMRRCSVSILSNIAEGSGRQHPKDSIQFFYISRGSLFELESQLYISADQKYISPETLVEGIDLITRCKKLINGFINYYKNLKIS